MAVDSASLHVDTDVGVITDHDEDYRHGASEIALAMIQNMWMRIGPFLNIVTPDIAHMRRSMDAHRQIVDALWRRDGAAARAG